MESTVGPELSRRQMFMAAGAVTLAAALPGLRRVSLPSLWPSHLTSTSSGGAGGALSGDGLTLSRFAPHVGSDFTVNTGTLGSVSVRLAEATARAPHPADRRGLRQGEAFSLIFRGHTSAGIPDGTHTVTHPALGAFPLFVAPVGMRRNGQDYQAVVDQRTATSP